jgi:peroxiredoxin
MPTVQIGDIVPPRLLTTVAGTQVPLPAAAGLTHLQFRRFAGCPICNVHLRSIARRYDEFRATGITEIAVFHSSADAMRPHQGALPFTTVPDPGRRLYAEFSVVRSPRWMLHPRSMSAPFKPATWSVMADAFRAGTTPFPRGDGVSGLPAEFLIAPDGVVRAAKYGRHASDHWPPDEILRLAR